MTGPVERFPRANGTPAGKPDRIDKPTRRALSAGPTERATRETAGTVGPTAPASQGREHIQPNLPLGKDGTPPSNKPGLDDTSSLEELRAANPQDLEAYAASLRKRTARLTTTANYLRGVFEPNGAQDGPEPKHDQPAAEVPGKEAGASDKPPVAGGAGNVPPTGGPPPTPSAAGMPDDEGFQPIRDSEIGEGNDDASRILRIVSRVQSDMNPNQPVETMPINNYIALYTQLNDTPDQPLYEQETGRAGRIVGIFAYLRDHHGAQTVDEAQATIRERTVPSEVVKVWIDEGWVGNNLIDNAVREGYGEFADDLQKKRTEVFDKMLNEE